MEQPIRHVEAPEESPEKTLGRRELLKALAAAGGAVAASSLLPGEWARPVVEVGVLPAHAQISARPLEATEYGIECNSDPGGGQLVHVPGASVIINNIRPRVFVISGTGSIDGIAVTMTPLGAPAPLPAFNRPFPDTRDTNASGVADFGNLTVTGANEAFYLVFGVTDPGSDAHYTIQCGLFELREAE
jgi:hypothetical protein